MLIIHTQWSYYSNLKFTGDLAGCERHQSASETFRIRTTQVPSGAGSEREYASQKVFTCCKKVDRERMHKCSILIVYMFSNPNVV